MNGNAGSTSFFDVSNLEKSFGGLRALDGASLQVERSEMVGLIGPNGAGKTTFFNCVTGTVEQDGGTVLFDGQDVTADPPHELARCGLVRTFQQTRVFPTMTVADNVKLPAANHPGERAWGAVAGTESARSREAEVEARADELLEFFELDHLEDAYADALSGGQRKLLEMARALTLDPSLVLLDEPFAGVNPTLVGTIVEYVERLNDEGMTFLVIEHEIETLAELVDRLVVLNQGQVLASGDPDEVLADDRVIDAYLGETV